MKKSQRWHRTDHLPIPCWHLDNHLPTSSCKRSLWTPPNATDTSPITTSLGNFISSVGWKLHKCKSKSQSHQFYDIMGRNNFLGGFFLLVTCDFKRYNAESPLENTNWINVILLMSEVIDLNLMIEIGKKCFDHL